ncbi:hypothetical protein [Granulibacter bethesdensis]|uniref:hypothetical protein n=1 Tax=Granulibacter bethesdensis TaxID=364410 RepID=UPI00046D5E79|nr:hypothetical protein [Granulibacter bethesdensis]
MEDSQKKLNIFGDQFFIQDEESARYAVRMSGLPILVIGLNFVVLFLFFVSQQKENLYFNFFLVGMAFFMITMAFRIRAERIAWFPLALLLFGISISANLFLSYTQWKFKESLYINFSTLFIIWFIPLICMYLMVRGWMGWRWLKSNKIKMVF